MYQAPKQRLNWSWNDMKSDVTKSHRLKNCNLVIDGQNFFYKSYEKSQLPYQFGAEANEYAKYLKKLLQKFKDVNIVNHFVFKGGDTDIEKKISKLWLTTYDFESNCRFVAPIFMKEIHHQVLDEMGLKYATSVMKSKDDCVTLANALQCPVVSEDRAFFYKGARYIQNSTIYFTSTDELPCRLYHLAELFHKYNLNDKKTTIFLALSDVTVFPQNYFRDLMRKLRVRRNTLSQELQRLLKWLSEHSELEAINIISKIFSTELDRNKFYSRLEGLEKNVCHNNESVVVKYLQNKLNLDNSYPSNYDPQWFEKGVATQKIAILYINLYKYKCIAGSWAIEKNKNCKDSIMLSIDIIKYAYNLLTNFEQTEITVYQSSKEFIKVNTELNFEKPIYQCTESVFENGWNEKHLELFEYFLYKNDINRVIINEVSPEARVLLIALVYFTRKKVSDNIQVTKEVYCFIVSYVMLNVIFDEKESFRKKENNINETDCVAATSVTTKYFSYSNSEAKEIFNENTLKTLVELQYCLLHMNYLNTLCGSPFMTTKYHRTFNGTFVYKLLNAMGDRNALQFIEELFETAPSVLKYVETLLSTYKKLL